ncbi:unnamed protein product, partial [marine sediment metagenome]
TTKLLELMVEKQSNLICSADVDTVEELLILADQVGPEIVMLKTHLDGMIEMLTLAQIDQLKTLAQKHKFLILEDRKFADIGSTLQRQLTGYHKMNEWVDAITCVPIFGSGTLEAFKKLNGPNNDIAIAFKIPAIFPVAQASSQGNLMDATYTKRVCEMVKLYPNLVAGLVSQKRLLSDNFLHLTPGVHLVRKKDGMDQRYRTVEDAFQSGSDLIIVGRGIYASD